MRDIKAEDTIYIAFTTRAFDSGIPFTLAGTPVISAYEDAGLTQITAGITLSVDHDGVTGLNMMTIVATAANGYDSGKDYNLVITTGTVDSVSVVGEVVGQFSIARSAAAQDLANGTDGLGAIKGDTAAVLTDTGTTLPATLTTMEGKIDTVDTNVDAVLVDTGTTLPATLTTMEGKIDTVDTNVDSILVDTGTTLNDKIDTIDSNVDSILVDTGTTLNDKIDVIDGNVDSILTDTGTTLPSTLTTIDGKIDTIDTNVDAILVDTSTTLDGKIDTIDTNVDSILTDTGTTLPATLAGLNDVSTAEVNAEVDTALSDINLDHLCKTATGAADMTTEVADNTILSRIIASGDTSAFDPTTDSLQDIRDKLTDVETDTAEIGAAGAGLSAVPYNSAWDADIQSECADALTAYDPPTKAEMDTAHALLATEAKQDIIDTNVDSVLTDTGTTLPATLAGLNDLSSANVQTACDAAITANNEVLRILGLTNSNIVYDDWTWSGDNETARSVYCYNSKANAQTHNKSTGLIGKYTLAATWSGDKPTKVTWTKES